MTIEIIRQELELFWQKVVFFTGQFADLARQIIQDPARVSRGDLILMIATLLIVALFLIGGVIRFITEPWKKKGQSLIGTVLVILVLTIIAFIVLRKVPLPNA